MWRPPGAGSHGAGQGEVNHNSFPETGWEVLQVVVFNYVYVPVLRESVVGSSLANLDSWAGGSTPRCRGR